MAIWNSECDKNGAETMKEIRTDRRITMLEKIALEGGDTLGIENSSPWNK
jgi:hypothetical protein